MPICLAVPNEILPGERRIALEPGVAKRLIAMGVEVTMEKGAALSAHFSDAAFEGVKIVDTPQELYKNADLLLVPSYTNKTSFEGFGLVYIEANAYGVPVIGPNTSGAAEAIKDGAYDYLIKGADTGKFLPGPRSFFLSFDFFPRGEETEFDFLSIL